MPNKAVHFTKFLRTGVAPKDGLDLKKVGKKKTTNNNV